VILSIILAATLCGAAVFLYVEDDPSDPDNDRDPFQDDGQDNGSDDESGQNEEPGANTSGMDNDITYVLYGGTNSDLNPAGYDNGTSVSLQAAYLD